MVLFLREKNRPDALIGNMPPFPDKCHRIGKYVNFVRMVTNGITASRPGGIFSQTGIIGTGYRNCHIAERETAIGV
jgi:hypothetical protein